MPECCMIKEFGRKCSLCWCPREQWDLHTQSWVAFPRPFGSLCFWLGFPLEANGVVSFL